MNILWVILWIVLVYDSPETHPFINEDEKGYIVTTRNSKKASQKTETVPPYFKIFTSGTFQVQTFDYSVSKTRQADL